MTAEVAILIYAKSAKEARAQASSRPTALWDSLIHHGDENGWSGWSREAVEILSLEQDRTGKPLRHTFEVAVDDLVASDRSFFPLEVDQAFEIFRHLVASGEGYEQRCTWHTQKLSHILDGGYSTNPFALWDHKPVLSLGDLKERLQFALLARGYPFYQEWREAVGYKLGGTLKIVAPHRGASWRHLRGASPHGSADQMLRRMLVDSKGMTLATSLNSSHPRAVEIQAAGVQVLPRGFRFLIRYGYPSDSSHWDFVLAETRGNEPFFETFIRAHSAFRQLVPDFDKQISDRHRLPPISFARAEPEPSLGS
ncbi:hypothetical protein [Sphingosinicella sp. BN140058]|uniref:hypothetical protein n=1 Tax=Sphingosinicella sp. BN140058 TaxID=1892855 RepID=UPI0010138B72|nr:hypothetical protein [Sphingosinicella sp. BN140058]QAY80447.1 hypothetical protein ETR14_27800 [Sphingosinicella sp. BN140058]